MTTPPPVTPIVPVAAAPQMVPVVVKSGIGTVGWVLIIVGGLFTICAVVFIAGGMFLFHKVKQAGFDPDLMRKNPSLAVGKMITAANPNTEVVSVDENSGIIHVRDKQTGKAFTMNFSDVKAGKMVFQEDGKDAVTISATGDGQKANVSIQSGGKDLATISATGDGQNSNMVIKTEGKDAATITSSGQDNNGTVEIKTSDGVARIGAGAGKAPEWMPVYPGSQTEGMVGADTSEGHSGSYHFDTKDSIEKVTTFYKARLQAAGVKVESGTKDEEDGSVTGFLQGEDAKGRKVVMFATKGDNGGTSVIASFTEKN